MRIGLCQPDLIGSRIYGEEKVAFMNDISILEIDADQRPADLGAELDLLNRGKLTNETQSRASDLLTTTCGRAAAGGGVAASLE